MCIRHSWNVAIVDRLEAETFIDADDDDARADALRLVAGLPQATFAHPLALARQLVKHHVVDDDHFATCARLVSPILRGFVRLIRDHGDLFAGTEHAVPPPSPRKPRRSRRLTKRSARKPAKAPRLPPPGEGGMPARPSAEDLRQVRRNMAAARRASRKAAAIKAHRHVLVEAFVATVKATRGVPRALPPNVIDFVAIRAQRAGA